MFQGRWSCVAPCQCATSLFQAFWRLLGFRLQGLWNPGLCRLTVIPQCCHFNEIHSGDVYNMMIINCQVHTVCLGIVSSIVVPSSFRIQRRAHESRSHLCFCFIMAALFSAARCIIVLARLTRILAVFVFLLHVLIPRFVHPTNNSVSSHG
jgi:hypothetical protein